MIGQPKIEPAPPLWTPEEVSILDKEIQTLKGKQLTNENISHISAVIQQKLGYIRTPKQIESMAMDIIDSISKQEDHAIQPEIEQPQNPKNPTQIVKQQGEEPLFKGFSFEVKHQQIDEEKIAKPVICEIDKPNTNTLIGQQLSKEVPIAKKQISVPSKHISKRKISPTQPVLIDKELTLEERFQNLQNLNNDCHNGMDKRNRKTSMKQGSSSIIQDNCQWFFNEYFYSNYEKPFFKKDLMKKIISQISKNNDEIPSDNFTYYDHRMLRLAFGKPRIFDEKFVHQQQVALNDSRRNIRQLVKTRQNDKIKDDIVELAANRNVIALHPICGHLHSGSILAIYRETQYVVKFTRPQLGTQKVMDIHISTQLAPGRKWSQQIIQQKNQTSEYSEFVENLDFEVMAITIKLLDFKNQLIQKLRQYNDRAQQIMLKGQVYTASFLEQYGWLGSILNVLSIGLKHIIARFRLRGLFQNPQQITKNLTTLLINPFNSMKKQLQNSSDPGDISASKKIGKFISNHKKTRVNETVQNLVMKKRQMLQENIEDPIQREKIQQLLKSCVGILADLKIEGKDFNLKDNSYITSLAQSTNENFNEYFNQIYDRIHNIVKKAKEM